MQRLHTCQGYQYATKHFLTETTAVYVVYVQVVYTYQIAKITKISLKKMVPPFLKLKIQRVLCLRKT